MHVSLPCTSVVVHAVRAAPAYMPGKAPAAPCTYYLTNAPSSRAASGLSTVPAHLRGCAASQHLRPICSELPIASPNNTMAEPDSRPPLCGISTRKRLPQAAAKNWLRGQAINTHRVPIWPKSSLRSKRPWTRTGGSVSLGPWRRARSEGVWGVLGAASKAMLNSYPSHPTALRTDQKFMPVRIRIVMHAGGQSGTILLPQTGRAKRRVCHCSP